jgi:hypothetical protein
VGTIALTNLLFAVWSRKRLIGVSLSRYYNDGRIWRFFDKYNALSDARAATVFAVLRFTRQVIVCSSQTNPIHTKPCVSCILNLNISTRPTSTGIRDYYFWFKNRRTNIRSDRKHAAKSSGDLKATNINPAVVQRCDCSCGLLTTPSSRHILFTNCWIASRAQYSSFLPSYWTSGDQLGLGKTALTLRFYASKEEIRR